MQVVDIQAFSVMFAACSIPDPGLEYSGKVRVGPVMLI